MLILKLFTSLGHSLVTESCQPVNSTNESSNYTSQMRQIPPNSLVDSVDSVKTSHLIISAFISKKRFKPSLTSVTKQSIYSCFNSPALPSYSIFTLNQQRVNRLLQVPEIIWINMHETSHQQQKMGGTLKWSVKTVVQYLFLKVLKKSRKY